MFAACWSSCVCALPSGGEIIRGEATLTFSPDALQIHAQGAAILQWDRFDIASHEAVHFAEAQGGHAILNRVMSGSASQILGSLRANCPIYLVNPQGVFIGSAALIDTAGFLASTADISNDCFLAQGELLFQELSGASIVNLGKISASGDIVLVARRIDNQGSIEAKNGSVLLATHELILHPDTKQSTFIRVDDFQEAEGIQNSGTIQALAVELKTRSPYEKAIQHRGLISALRAAHLNGRIYLVADEGGCIIDAPLIAEEGIIEIAAGAVHLTKQALLDVSSGVRGGAIQISSVDSRVDPGAQLLANAVVEGDGGSIALAADEQLFFHGLAEVRGGAFGGDGGTVHLSSNGSFQLEAQHPFVSASAPNGRSGTLLLDPKFVTISPDGSDPATGNTFGLDPSGSAIISGASLQTALDAANVVIQANTDIVFQDAIAASTPGSSLTLQAGRSIQIYSDLTLNAGDLIVTINDSGAVALERDPGVAAFTLANSAIVATQGGNITLDVGMFDGLQEGEIYLSDSTLDAGGGNIAIAGFARQDGSDDAYGIFVESGAVLQTIRAGTLSFDGTGGNGANNNAGICLFGGQLQTDAGLLQLTGHGGGNGSGNGSVGIYSAAQVGSTSGGEVLFNGFAGIGVHGNMGVYLCNGQISTLDGNITLRGTGGGTGALNFGVRLESSAQCISTGAGILTLSGMSGSGKNNNHGVILSGSSLEANTGAISITGIGQGSIDCNYGIRLEGASTCSSTGTAPISLNGQNHSGRTGSAGVSISTSGMAITSSYGDIQIDGVSNGTAALSQGIRLESGQIVSTGAGVGAANIHLRGTGSTGTDFCNGVAVGGLGGDSPDLFGTVIESIDGNIILEGTAQGSGQGNQALAIDPTSLIDTTGSGMITYIEH